MDKKGIVIALINHYTNGNKAQFADKLGVSPQTISTWVSRNTFDVDKVFAKCECINPEWLLTGTGAMLKADRRDGAPIYEQNPATTPEKAVHTSNPKEGIPLIPIDAMAGFASGGEAHIMEYECERYIVPMFKGANVLIQVKGSSMIPKYNSGDVVACKYLPLTDIFFQWNKVYVLDTAQGALIKRVKPGTDNEHIILVSDNEKYDPFPLRLDQIHALALVIGVIRLE